MRSGQNHIEGNGESGANKEDLEHEIVEGLIEDSAERLGRDGGAVVVSEGRSAFGEVLTGQASINVNVEKLWDGFSSLEVVLEAQEILIICARFVSLNEIDKLIFCYTQRKEKIRFQQSLLEGYLLILNC